jgi:outer membrane receptor protein involved in Fe transport
VPVFGEDFNIPLFRNLEFNPGIRFVRQRGAAPAVRLLNGQLADTESEGRWNEIYSLAGTWKPIRDITFRGNYTRSIRQPSIVELFLGGQPAFTGVTDPCAPAQLAAGLRPTTRRANCIAAVRAAGLAASDAEAVTFLNNYVPSGAGIQGNFAGSPGLKPERGTSWTVGGVLQPRFIPGLSLSADYINVKLQDQIIPTTIVTALQVCYDSPGFPNTAGEVGVNVCDFFSRIPAGRERQFEVDNGFNSGFINLGGLQVEAVNATFQYKMPIDEWFNNSSLGTFELYSNVYHLISFKNSPSGNFNDTQELASSIGRPQWEVQVRGRYDNNRFYAQWVWNWSDRTRLYSAGAAVPGTDTQNELQDLINYPAYSLHDATIGMYLNDKRTFNLQFIVRNVFDKQFIGAAPQAFALPNASGRIDDFGRRFVVSANVRF